MIDPEGVLSFRLRAVTLIALAFPTPRAGRAPAPQYDPPSTPPQRDVSVPTPRPEAPPRGEVRALPAGTPDEVPPKRAQPKAVEKEATTTPMKAPSRRVSPGPA